MLITHARFCPIALAALGCTLAACGALQVDAQLAARVLPEPVTYVADANDVTRGARFAGYTVSNLTILHDNSTSAAPDDDRARELAYWLDEPDGTRWWVRCQSVAVIHDGVIDGTSEAELYLAPWDVIPWCADPDNCRGATATSWRIALACAANRPEAPTRGSWSFGLRGDDDQSLRVETAVAGGGVTAGQGRAAGVEVHGSATIWNLWVWARDHGSHVDPLSRSEGTGSAGAALTRDKVPTVRLDPALSGAEGEVAALAISAGLMVASPALPEKVIPVRLDVVPRPPIVTRLALGGWNACVRLTDGRARCWDRRDASTPASRPGVGNVVSVAAANDHACAVRADGQVVCWWLADVDRWSGVDGVGTASGRAGWSEPSVIFGPTGVIEVVVGDEESCARTNEGVVYCWGTQKGWTADGTNLPVAIPGAAGAIRLLPFERALAVVATDGTVHVTGVGGERSAWRRLPALHDLADLSAPYLADNEDSYGVALLRDRTVATWCHLPSYTRSKSSLCDAANPPAPHAVPGLHDIVEIVAVTAFRGCALDREGVLSCWVLGGDGTLGDASAPRGQMVAVPTPRPVLTGVAQVEVDPSGAGKRDGSVCVVFRDGALSCGWGTTWTPLEVPGMN